MLEVLAGDLVVSVEHGPGFCRVSGSAGALVIAVTAQGEPMFGAGFWVLVVGVRNRGAGSAHIVLFVEV